MLDASNPETNHKSKKSKTQSNRPVQRFWPDNIASLQPQVQNSNESDGPNGDHQISNSSDAQASTSGMNDFVLEFKVYSNTIMCETSLCVEQWDSPTVWYMYYRLSIYYS